jgi:hypothetical protein
VHIEDVEAAAAVHQHLREPRVADDRVDDQRVLARVGDAVWVILTAEGGGVLRPIEKRRRSLLRGENLVSLSLALAVGHVHARPLKMTKTFSTTRKPLAPISVVLLGLVLLRDEAAVVLLEHVALFEGVVDRGLVVRAWLLQHVVE